MTSLDSISEVPASGATQLRTAAQAAILAAAGGRLKRVARGWIGNGIAAPIRDTIIADLKRRGLLTAGTDRATALTVTGKWYARTLARRLALIPQPNDEALG
jgi:hypothetical protein